MNKTQPSGPPYRCPNKCGDPRFPRPKWKTEAGLTAHLAKCPQRPEALAQQAADKAKREGEEQTRKSAALATAKHKIGETIHYIHKYVRKPTHESRFGRMVRVRYEEERSYSARSAVISSIGWDGCCVIYNHGITEGDIAPTLAEAEERARKTQADYDAACKFASDCR